MAARRLFVAMALPSESRGEIARWLASVGRPRGLRLVPAAKLHITLKFLGNLDDSAIAPLGRKLTEVAALHAPIRLAPAGAGVFPDERRPRVLWIGIDEQPAGAMAALAGDCDAVATTFGVKRESGPFRPHVTIARIATRDGADAARQLLPQLAEQRGREFIADELTLFESAPAGGGTEYVPLMTAPLSRSPLT